MNGLKYRNYGLWVSIGALVVMAVTDLTNATAESVQDYVNIGLAILAGAGVISNPEKGRGFKDGGAK